MLPLQINPLTELLVELGVMVACPGKERLVKVGTRGRDAKDAGNFDAYKLQCRQLVDGSEGKRGRGLLEQIAAALQRVATGARVAERRGFGGSRAYGLVAATLMKVSRISPGTQPRAGTMASALVLAVSMAMCPASLGVCAMAMLLSLSVR